MAEFQVEKQDPTQSRIVETEPRELADGEVLLQIDRVALTANNLTYAVVGEQIGYWRFFPPSGDEPERWGIIPVWGFADVIASMCEELPIGERLYGYLPPAHDLILTPTTVSARRLVDGSPHRSELPAGYNSYERVRAPTDGDHTDEHLKALLAPLHLTSFALADSLQSEDWYEAQRVVILSASSKTSIGLAYALQAMEGAPPVVGLTSAGNRAFVEGLATYDEVLDYDHATDLAADVPTVIVDMAGNRALAAGLHEHLGERMRFHVGVGLTHWDQAAPAGDDGFAADRATFFFAPSHIQQRMKEWGPAEFAKRTEAFLEESARRSREWMEITPAEGIEELAALYPELAAGRLSPQQGVIIRL